MEDKTGFCAHTTNIIFTPALQIWYESQAFDNQYMGCFYLRPIMRQHGLCVAQNERRLMQVSDWHTFLFTSAWLSHLRNVHTSYPASLTHSSRSTRTGSLHHHKPNNVREILTEAGQEGSGAKRGEKLYRSLKPTQYFWHTTYWFNHQLPITNGQRASLWRNQPIPDYPVKVRFLL